MTILSLLCTQIGAGILAYVPFAGRREVGPSFFSFMAALSFAMFLIGLVFHPAAQLLSDGAEYQTLYSVAFASMAFCALAAGVFSVVARWRPESIHPKWLLYTATVALVAVVANSLAVASGTSVEPWLYAMSSVSASGMLGGVLATMILGHWYLVRPKLPIRYLRFFFHVFMLTFAARLLILVFALIPIADTPEFVRLVSLSDFLYSSGLGLFFYLRILFGLVVPALFSWMIWQTIRIRSTQSATGLLYLLTLFIFIGEATAMYLFLISGVPL